VRRAAEHQSPFDERQMMKSCGRRLDGYPTLFDVTETGITKTWFAHIGKSCLGIEEIFKVCHVRKRKRWMQRLSKPLLVRMAFGWSPRKPWRFLSDAG
jgi:hypothetical protein